MTIGRIVLYCIAPGEIRPAIVTRVESNELVDMYVFGASGDDEAVTGPETSVRMDEPAYPDGLTPGTWRWPVRESV